MSHTGSSGGQPGPQRTTDRATALSEPARAYAELVAGNRRFVGGAPRHPNQDAGHRAAVADGQHPFAVIVGCSDSRLAAEIIFDRGLGDLFVVRTAGHTAGPEVLGSVEYAVTVLGTPLVVVLGHDSCGAVQAARESAATGTHRVAICARWSTPCCPACAGPCPRAWTTSTASSTSTSPRPSRRCSGSRQCWPTRWRGGGARWWGCPTGWPPERCARWPPCRPASRRWRAGRASTDPAAPAAV